MTQSSDEPAPPDQGPSRDLRQRPLGLTVFTLEGRAAPALFLVGWLASLIGLGATVVATRVSGPPGVVLFAAGTAILTIGLIAAAGSQAIERRAVGVTTYAGPSPLLVFAASLSLALFLSVAVGAPLLLLGLNPNAPVAALLGAVLVFGSYVAIVRLLVVGTGSLSWHDLGLRRANRLVLEDVAWGMALAVPVLLATGLVGRILSLFLPVEQPILPPATDVAGILLNLVTAAVIAPIGEELFFRGFATTAWARLYGPRRALVQGSILFAAAHLLTQPASDPVEGIKVAVFTFLVRLPVAFALGWLFLQRRTLVAPIFLHAAFNGLQVLLLAATSGAAGGG